MSQCFAADIASTGVDELAASLDLDDIPDETPASGSAPSTQAGLAPSGDDARIVVADPGGFTCRFCPFDRGRKATVTKHEKKEHPEEYAKNAAPAPKKRGAKNVEAPNDPAHTHLWDCTMAPKSKPSSKPPSKKARGSHASEP